MEGEIVFRVVLEVVGKPQEHVEKSIKEYISNIKKDKDYQIISEEFAEIKKHDEEGLWATFAELEIKTDKIQNIVGFCFNYMPSIVEVLEPAKMPFTSGDFSNFLNDLQARLHQIDLVAKQLRAENVFMKKNMGGLLKNYVTVLLSKGELTSPQLSGLTGLTKDKLEDFLDQMIDKGEIDLKEGKYSLKGK
ncbi:MAG: hypothetical protein KJ597_06555 [Nanoarchaeota archaeon]|nr:hypothetical protein [Nanoarchaeota archaeon]